MFFTHRRFLVAISAATFVVTFFYGEISYTKETYTRWDLLHYEAMAEAVPALAMHVDQPFCFRLLGPYIVGLVPLATPLAFQLFSIGVSLMLVILFYFFLSFQQIEPSIAAVTTVLFTLNRYLFGFTIWDYFQLSDIFALIFLILLLFAMRRFRWMLFSCILCLGALTRETVLIMIPTALVYLLERHQTDQLKWLALAIVPCVLVFVLLRLLIPVGGGNDLLTALTLYAPKLLSHETWYRLLVNSFIPFTFLPVIFWPVTREYLLQHKYAVVFLALVFLSTLFAENNERLLAPASIIFYVILAQIIQKHLSNPVPLLGLVIGGLLTFPHHQIARYPLPDKQIMIVLSVVALFFTTFVGLFYRRSFNQKQTHASPIA